MSREDLITKIKLKASNYKEEVINIRRHIHQNPELSFQEYNTSKYIQNKLTEFEIEFTSGIVETGIVALIKGKNPTKKTIALRADIDALPIQEENTIDYKSINKGIMHACGHDVHSASLLGTAKILNELKNEFEGTIKLIFQPGEEKLPGGASLMIKEGVLENPKPKAIIGQHVFPDLPAGKVGFKPGMYMASCDEIYITVKGKGGHAALPHTFIDPIFISSSIITSLQQIVSRRAKPSTPTVLSFGKINSKGGATNIIPDEVYLEGTFRTMDETWRQEAHKLIKKIATDIAKTMGGVCVIDIKNGYPFLKNDETLTTNSFNLAHEYLGTENVVELDLRMTGEDFAFYAQQIPGCFYRLGTGESSGLHTSTFNIDETAIETSIGLMSWLAISNLE
jgi:amidohydrolase